MGVSDSILSTAFALFVCVGWAYRVKVSGFLINRVAYVRDAVHAVQCRRTDSMVKLRRVRANERNVAAEVDRVVSGARAEARRIAELTERNVADILHGGSIQADIASEARVRASIIKHRKAILEVASDVVGKLLHRDADIVDQSTSRIIKIYK